MLLPLPLILQSPSFNLLSMTNTGASLKPRAASLILLTEVVFAGVSSVLLGAAELQARTLFGAAPALWAAWPLRTESAVTKA